MNKGNNELIIKWLEDVGQVGMIVDKLAQALVLLSSKRATLEEKMISSYLHQLAAEYGNLLSQFHCLACQSRHLLPECQLEDLRQTNRKALEAIEEFLKVARFDLNFLEQYFEYDFCHKLTLESGLLDKLKEISLYFQSAQNTTGNS